MLQALLVMTLAAVLSTTLMLRPQTASAHYIGCDSVDESPPLGEVRWTSSTSLTAQRDHAINAWNGVGNVNIAPDTASSAADVRFSDVNRSDVTWWGEYTCRPILVDTIKFNLANMGSLSDFMKRKVATHELGHALRLGHSITGNVMMQGFASVNTPQSHDIADYCARWSCGTAGGGGGAGGGNEGPARRMK
jgi:hypothetical protein